MSTVAEVQDDLLAQLAQVAGDDEVIKVRGAAGVLKMGREGGIGGGGHGGAHVVGVLDALVDDLAGGDVGHMGAGAGLGQHHRPGAGDRPLGGGGALATVFQRSAVLPLGGAEVGGGHRPGKLGKASVDHHSSQGQALSHGGAGSVEAEEGHVLAPDGKA